MARSLMDIKRTKKNLKYVFTPSEISGLGLDLAREYAACTDAETRKKDIDAQLKADIEKHSAKAESLSRRINNGYEYRDIDCEELIDYKNKTVTIKRLDTGEIVSDRNLTVDELQTSLSSYGEGGYEGGSRGE